MIIQDHIAANGFQEHFVGSYKYRLYSSEPVAEVLIASRHPVYYSGVTEYSYSGNGTKNGKTIYSYTSPAYFKNYSSVPVPGGAPFGMQVGIGGTDDFYPQVFSFYEWSKPQLATKVIQKYDPVSDSYKSITSENINYVTLNSFTIPQVSLYKYLEFPIGDHNYPLTSGVYEKEVIINPVYNWSVYNVLDRTISCAVKKPSSQTTVTYDDAGNQLTSKIDYFYDNLNHVNPTRTVITTSDNRTIAKFTSFSKDYPSGTPFIDDLVSSNILNNPIEEVTVQTSGGVSKILSGKLTTYTGSAVKEISQLEQRMPVSQSDFKFSNSSSGSLPFTGTATSFTPDGRYAPKLTFNEYDIRNNPKMMTPANNVPVFYIWGHNYTYPLAEVKNAMYKDVFYNGFEEIEGNGTSGDAKAGLWSHSGSYVHTIPDLSDGQYTFSYWQKSGTVWILQTSNVAVTAGTYTINTAGQVDEIRFYPANAQMTSYTYTPLLGMTSQSDINHNIVSYEYDDYQRLKRIRDRDQNIVKKNDYNIATPLYYNESKTVALLKSDCDPTLYLGSSVNYTVDEYTYSGSSIQEANNKRGRRHSSKGPGLC